MKTPDPRKPAAASPDDWLGAIAVRKPLAALTGATAGPARRRKLWDLAGSLHCSVIGTCLMSGELRGVLRRSGAVTEKTATDHDLHEAAVGSAGRREETAKEIQKTLDQIHKAAIARFDAAKSADELRRLWDEAAQSGDVSGPYWALLSHPLCTDELLRRAFGDVHMLSHLVGSANRVALQKLRRLEAERAELDDKLARQQERLREAVVSRDAKIDELAAALGARAEREAGGPDGSARSSESSELAALNHVVTDLRKQLDREGRRRERAENKLADALIGLSAQESDRAALASENAALRDEAAAAEAALAELTSAETNEGTLARSLAGTTLLYVGGRPRQAAQMKLLVERAGGHFLHHDGGVEESADLLPGLVSRADVALFPVDCISHAAALSLKQICRQAGKRFVPLRSSSITSLLRALESFDLHSAAPHAG